MVQKYGATWLKAKEKRRSPTIGIAVALVVADSAEKWPRFEQAIGPVLYVRLHGEQELYASGYTDAALDRWAERISEWTADGRDAFVYFDNDMKGHAPWDARKLIGRLDR